MEAEKTSKVPRRVVTRILVEVRSTHASGRHTPPYTHALSCFCSAEPQDRSDRAKKSAKGEAQEKDVEMSIQKLGIKPVD